MVGVLRQCKPNPQSEKFRRLGIQKLQATLFFVLLITLYSYSGISPAWLFDNSFFILPLGAYSSLFTIFLFISLCHCFFVLVGST